MEGSSEALQDSTGRNEGAERITQLGLAVASLGAVFVVFNLFGLGIVGLFCVAIGAALAAPGGAGRGWYMAVAGGAAAAVTSRFVAEGTEVIGGWLAVFASTAILVGTCLGFPVKARR